MTGDTDPCLHPCPHPGLTPVLGKCATNCRYGDPETAAILLCLLPHSSALIRIPFRGGRGSQHEARPMITATHTTLPASRLCTPTSCELHTTLPGSGFGFTPHILRASHHSPGSRFCFTPHILQADFASHHTSCKPTLLHTTHPACFTPHVLQADFASHHTS